MTGNKDEVASNHEEENFADAVDSGAAGAASSAAAAAAAAMVNSPNPFFRQMQEDPQATAWFQQMIGTAAVAAAAAIAAVPRQGQAALNPAKVHDRKVPDFWETRPRMWFRLLDAHLAKFQANESTSFDALIPLLTL